MDNPQPRPFRSWVALLVAGVFVALGGINLWAQMLYSMNGVRASGKVIEAHAAQARSISIDAQVEVILPGVAPFRWDVDDAFGMQSWEQRGTVSLLCTHIHADHISCVVDSLLDRFFLPLLTLSIGAGVAFLALRRRGGSVQ